MRLINTIRKIDHKLFMHICRVVFGVIHNDEIRSQDYHICYQRLQQFHPNALTQQAHDLKIHYSLFIVLRNVLYFYENGKFFFQIVKEKQF